MKASRRWIDGNKEEYTGKYNDEKDKKGKEIENQIENTTYFNSYQH